MTDEVTQTENANVDAPVDPKVELNLLKQRAGIMGITFSNNITVETLRAKIEAKLAAADDAEENQDPDQSDDPVSDDDAEGPSENNETAPAEPPVPDVSVSKTAPVSNGLSEADAAELAAFRAAAANPPATNPLGNDPAPALDPNKKLTKAERDGILRKQLHDEGMKLIRLRITNLDPKKADLQGEIFTVANEYLGTVKKFIPYGDATENGYHVPQCIYDQLLDRKFLLIRTVKDRRTGTTRPETRWVSEFSLEVLPQLTEEELERLAIAQAASGAMDEFAI